MMGSQNMMGSDFQFREKVSVGILGATGTVGQKFVEMLARHPWFQITALAASEKSSGKTYKKAVNWLMGTPIPEEIGDLIVQPCTPDLLCDLVFSGLDSSVAGEIETAFANAGYVVVSNSRNHRMDPNVPLLIPEVNPDHLALIKKQNFVDGGVIVTNPNCAAVGLAVALKPLLGWGLEKVSVVTMQSISGAGYPGVASLDIVDNVIPYINDEEPKLESEPKKILGSLRADGTIDPLEVKISAQCNRVPVTNGHMECIAVKFKNKPKKEEIIEAWNEFVGEPQNLRLPNAPKKPIVYYTEEKYPQPRLHREGGNGMVVSIGRLREDSILDYKFVVLSHNTIRGAAGGAILNAELMLRNGYIFW
jgi:aspartate-semialdehyde dehydrogenase